MQGFWKVILYERWGKKIVESPLKLKAVRFVDSCLIRVIEKCLHGEQSRNLRITLGNQDTTDTTTQTLTKLPKEVGTLYGSKMNLLVFLLVILDLTVAAPAVIRTQNCDVSSSCKSNSYRILTGLTASP
jgi:hypothetical protein